MEIGYAAQVDDKELLARISACDPPVRAWALEEGHKNLKGRIDSQAAVASQAATTLALLLAGIGGSLAYAVRIFEPDASPIGRGAAALCLYLILLAAVLIFRCINTTASPALHNEPKNLLMPGASLDQIQAGELLNLQRRIEEQTALVAARARWLNGVRLLALLSPAVFSAAALA
ncbi:hypothetical protein [Piscinibacter defluvii]|uniref:hypothetical protein n=1 Tax=Piscinibacter defluvii TaxID=1796922 RepID=UPI000FDDDCF1|nr:hypothetical protein [Piscinibacter defluvii]